MEKPHKQSSLCTRIFCFATEANCDGCKITLDIRFLNSDQKPEKSYRQGPYVLGVFALEVISQSETEKLFLSSCVCKFVTFVFFQSDLVVMVNVFKVRTVLSSRHV